MKAKAEEFVAKLLNGESHEVTMNSSEDFHLPKWLDEEKVARGQQFFRKYFLGFATSFMFGLMIVHSVPSILKVMANSRKSNSPRTAYRRYWRTFQHVFRWVYGDFKHGSKVWKSFEAVRKSHLGVIKSAKLSGRQTISQRDTALTLTLAVAYSYLTPDNFGIYQYHKDDWESFNHFWAVLGYCIGLEDRYNLCKRPFEETCEISRILVDRVFTPCMENPPEYFEHVVRAALDGASAFYPSADTESLMYLTRNLAGVPGYLLKESERLLLRKKLMKLNGNLPHIGVKSRDLVEKCLINGLPERESPLLYISDYDSIDTSPAYRQLSMTAKYKIALGQILMAFYSTSIGRVILNFFLKFQLLVSEYFPYVAIWRFGYSGVYYGDVDDTLLKPNSEFYKL